MGETDKAGGGHLSINYALTSQPDFPMLREGEGVGRGTEGLQGTVYFSRSAAGSLPRGHVLPLFLCFIF